MAESIASSDGDREQPLTTWGSGTGDRGTALRDGVVLKPGGPWVPAVSALLRHLESAGFAGAPRVVGDGVASDGRMQVSWVVGASPHPGPWADEHVHLVGTLLRGLHDATTDFEAMTPASWQAWWLRDVIPARTTADIVIGHGDAAPWNIVGDGGIPMALVDWEYAGPVDRLAELAYATWLNAQLHDDDVAERQG